MQQHDQWELERHPTGLYSSKHQAGPPADRAMHVAFFDKCNELPRLLDCATLFTSMTKVLENGLASIWVQTNLPGPQGT
jgi:hypothetical protein